MHGVSKPKQSEESSHIEQGVAGAIEAWLRTGGNQISICIQDNWTHSLSEKKDTNIETEKIGRTQWCWIEIKGISMNCKLMTIYIYIYICNKE